MPRSADDSWDITTSVGFTALLMCAARALDAALDPPLANDDFAVDFVLAAGEPNLIANVTNTDMTSPPGFSARWVGVRTRFFDNFYIHASRSGARQAVILAAGLDCRAYRLAWPAGCTVFEVDQPRVLEFKQQVLDQQDATPSARRVTVASDLREDWADALLATGFDANLTTAWGLEGLLPYLPGPAQDGLFERLHDMSAPGSQLAAELGPEPGELQEITKTISALSQHPTQPPVTDLWYDDPRLNTKEWLAERRWSVTHADLFEKAANEYGRPFHELPQAFERVMRSKYFTAKNEL